MPRRNRRGFRRPLGIRRYRRMFVLATEGARTEPLYFLIFNSRDTAVHMKHLKGRSQNAPVQVLRRMKDYLHDNRLVDEDEAWLVVDRDQWREDQLLQLHTWCQTDPQYGLAVSNPEFEYWLLLHFEDGTGIENSRQCTERLKRHLPHYSKAHLEAEKLQPRIGEAIERAKQRDNPPCIDWPRNTGTTVCRLVEKLMQTRN